MLAFTYLKDNYLPGKGVTLEYREIKGSLLNLNRFPYFLHKQVRKKVSPKFIRLQRNFI